MWIPNIPVLFLQGILGIVAVVSFFKDREYVRKYYKTKITDKRTNFWTILLLVCLAGEFIGFIAQAFSYFVEVAP